MKLDYDCHKCKKKVMLIPNTLERSSGKSGCLRWKSTAICKKCRTELFRLVYKESANKIFKKVRYAHKIEVEWEK